MSRCSLTKASGCTTTSMQVVIHFDSPSLTHTSRRTSEKTSSFHFYPVLFLSCLCLSVFCSFPIPLQSSSCWIGGTPVATSSCCLSLGAKSAKANWRRIGEKRRAGAKVPARRSSLMAQQEQLPWMWDQLVIQLSICCFRGNFYVANSYRIKVLFKFHGILIPPQWQFRRSLWSSTSLERHSVHLNFAFHCTVKIHTLKNLRNNIAPSKSILYP